MAYTVDPKGNVSEVEKEAANVESPNKENNILLRHVSLEKLVPVHECHSRKSSAMVAVIGLVATTCGGGVLSLPLAFRRAGIIPTTLFMLYGVCANDFALYILVSCARRTGGRSYGDVAQSAFGSSAEVVTTILLGLLLIGSLTAYLVLVKDIWTPLVLSLLPNTLRQSFLEPSETTEIEDDFEQTLVPSKEGSGFILFVLVLIGFPLMVKDDLHALRHTSYVGLLSCATLMVAVVYRAYQAVTSNDPSRPPLNWYSTNFSDYAFALPIVILCFQCSYNVLGVHSSLLNPTRSRLKFVLDSSMLACFLLFYLTGLGGYLYALDDTRDNILLNFPMHDRAVLLGRLGFCFTLLFCLPLVTLPCREALRSLPVQFHHWRTDTTFVKEFEGVDQHREEGMHLVINGVDFDMSEPAMVTDDPEHQHVTMLTYGSTHNIDHVVGRCDSGTTESTSEESQAYVEVPPCEHHDKFDFKHIIHYGLTLAIVGLCFVAATSVSGVGFVWSLCGSSMGIIITYIIPTTCYLKIRARKGTNIRSVVSWTLLIIACIAAPVCTQQAICRA